MNLANKAEIFARAAHSAVKQTRKFSDGKVPYIVHPMRVADLVSEGRGTVEMQAAAWLHDVCQDDIPKLLFARANELLYGNFYENKMVSSYSDPAYLLQTDFL